MDLGPAYPPNGTSLTDLFRLWVSSMRVGLYTHAVQDCPPPPYDQLLQPSWPGYEPVPLVSLAAVDVPPGEQLTARRLLSRFVLPENYQPFAAVGWFAFTTLRDGAKVVVLVRPFPEPLTFGPPERQVLIQPELTVAPALGAQGADVLEIYYARAVSSGGRMAFLFRGEQRAALRSLKRVLAKLSAWDANRANLSPRSRLARQPILQGVPTDLEVSAGPPPVFVPGDFAAAQVLAQLNANLAMTAPSSPP